MAQDNIPSVVPKDVFCTASDVLLKASTDTVENTSTDWVIKKSIRIPSNRVRSTLRVTFSLKTTSDINAVYGQIYVNGAAVGVEHSTQETSYVTFSEDIPNIRGSAEVQLYLKDENGSGYAYSDNLSVKGDETEVDQEYTVIL